MSIFLLLEQVEAKKFKLQAQQYQEKQAKMEILFQELPEQLEDGGNGGAWDTGNGRPYTGVGSNGTSYSGGTGGGSHVIRDINGYAGDGPVGKSNGGIGGSGKVVAGYYHSGSAGGGTGNPGGNGANINSGMHIQAWEGTDSSHKGNDGTGGLLVISCNKYNNNGTIEANGVGSRAVGNVSGGASGGGSVNIFYNEFVRNNSCIANGGVGANYGGSGGAGSITIGNISTGVFVKEQI